MAMLKRYKEVPFESWHLDVMDIRDIEKDELMALPAISATPVWNDLCKATKPEYKSTILYGE